MTRWTEKDLANWQSRASALPPREGTQKLFRGKASPTEHKEQTLLFRWSKNMESVIPELTLLFAIPNGGDRHLLVAKKLKAEGVKRGVPDICLPVPRGGFAGLYIEMKKKGGRIRPEQDWWIHALIDQGYVAQIKYGFDEAKETIIEYLNLKPSKGGNYARIEKC